MNEYHLPTDEAVVVTALPLKQNDQETNRISWLSPRSIHRMSEDLRSGATHRQGGEIRPEKCVNLLTSGSLVEPRIQIPEYGFTHTVGRKLFRERYTPDRVPLKSTGEAEQQKRLLCSAAALSGTDKGDK